MRKRVKVGIATHGSVEMKLEKHVGTSTFTRDQDNNACVTELPSVETRRACGGSLVYKVYFLIVVVIRANFDMYIF